MELKTEGREEFRDSEAGKTEGRKEGDDVTRGESDEEEKNPH